MSTKLRITASCLKLQIQEMKPNSSSRNEATEKMLRRREWKLEQERQRQHEKLKQKKIYEYEMQRIREKGLLSKKPANCGKSRSTSPRDRPRRPCTFSSTNTPILSERLESSDGIVPVFKGPEGTKISAAELRRIKVDIQRNIPGKSIDSDLQRDIINPKDVVVKRRAGEESKPISAREEFKGVVTNIEEVAEHRTVVTVNNDTLEGKLKTFKKRSTSLSPIRNRSHSPRRTLSRHSRNGRYYREYRMRSRERSQDRRDRDRSREQRVSPQHYFRHIPVPIYCTHFLPNPLMMPPLMSIRGQVPQGTNRLSSMMRSLDAFFPRFVLSYVHRLPLNPSNYRANNF